MAQQRPKKHKPRNRPDPARRAISAQRDQARRLAAGERRKTQEAAERRTALRKRIRRLVIPALVGIAVFVVAIVVFKPQREIKGVEKTEMSLLFDRLGYQLPGQTDSASLPSPVCGALAEPIASAEQLYSDLDNGAVVLWYQTAGDPAIKDALAVLANAYPSHVVVSPSASLTDPVVATAWRRWMPFETSDDTLRSFVDMYRNRAPGRAPCPMPTP
jgi:hypothetical protein